MILACHLTALVLTTCFLIHCPARDFIGINVGYDYQFVDNFFLMNFLKFN